MCCLSIKSITGACDRQARPISFFWFVVIRFWHIWVALRKSRSCWWCFKTRVWTKTLTPLPSHYRFKRDLLQCQKRPSTVSKDWPHYRPTTVSKETYYSVKRDPLQYPSRQRSLDPKPRVFGGFAAQKKNFSMVHRTLFSFHQECSPLVRVLFLQSVSSGSLLTLY